MQTGNGATWGCVFGSTPPGGVYCIFRDVVNCAGGCAGTNVFFSEASQLKHQSQIPLGLAFPVSVITTMAEFTKFDDAQVSGQPPISEELMTLLTAATVHKSILEYTLDTPPMRGRRGEVGLVIY